MAHSHRTIETPCKTCYGIDILNCGNGIFKSCFEIIVIRVFRAAKAGSSVTKECWKETGEVAERDITLVDTPGLFDTDISEENLKHEISKCVNMTAPGPHAIVLVIQPGPFTEEERRSVEKIRAIFGEEADKHTIILFTHGDELTDSIEQTLSEARHDLRHVIDQCGGGYHVFDNTNINDRSQVVELLEKVDKMLLVNGDEYYTSAMFHGVEEMLRVKEEELKKHYSQIILDLTETFNEEKRELQDTIEKLKRSGQEKDVKMKRLEVLMKEKILAESKRHYEQKHKTARQEAEETQMKENIPEQITKLRKLRV
ncbi:GTPase IMAP family member 7-like [Triplophysa rosa]|uniref:GTPase IMAP family member 7-like n=1 Tax=Triplophysa rosa TaxID=992332 RepID=UPI0025463229|nr:GTPase IMAP family member 7-like [Triplophysa rosa]